MLILKKTVLALFLFLCCAGLYGQGKKTLTPADYERWYHFHHYVLSPDGKWVNYIIHNPKGKDTMVLQNTNKVLKQIVMGGTQGCFSPQSDWFAFVRDKRLYYQKLQTNWRDSVPSVDHYFFSRGGMYLIGERKSEKELVMIHLATNTIHMIQSVESYVLSPDSTKIALVQQKEHRKTLCIIPFAKNKKVFELAQYDENLTGLTWNTKGNGVAFLKAIPTPEKSNMPFYQLYYFTFKEKNLPEILHSQSSTLLSDSYRIPFSRLFFSSDDKQLFFDVKVEQKSSSLSEDAIIWSSAAQVLPPPNEENKMNQWVMCWHLTANRFVLVNDAEQPVAIPTLTGKHALVVDKAAYLPHFEYKGMYADLFIVNLETGKKKRIVQKINHEKNHIVVSPHGKYITWFTAKNWWIYDIALDTIRCLTCSTQAHFEDLEYDRPSANLPNDKPYWTTKDQAVLLTDFNDVWLFTPDGKLRKRLTDGYARQSRFRLSDDRLSGVIRDLFFPYQTRSYAIEKGIVLKEVNMETLAEGLSFYTSAGALQHVFYGEDKINAVQKAGKTFMYVRSDFDKSPELVIHHSDKPEGVVIQRSNEHQKEYQWGKSELIHYTANGVPLKGALFYPADYQPDKTYPMVVKLYERMSSLLRKYVKPSLYHSVGFNVTHYTQAGYFVLLPDIAYTINKPGESALECVQAAVDESISAASVDPEKIGLFGHSFAGFEVSYIATRTQRFKTIVSGSGWHDLIGTYLGIDDHNESNIWRFDTQQLRITEPYYTKEFQDNSPVMHAHQIQTPMLLWTGMEDLRVNWRNSIKMQFALWRLGKTSSLLLYPGEGHVLLEPHNQYDLNTKIQAWYDHYLKGKAKPDWVN